jgi:hypothetical protein
MDVFQVKPTTVSRVTRTARTKLKSPRLVLLLVVGFIGVVALGALTGFGWTGQMRLDSGDVRYCFWGVPLSTTRMTEPQRTVILRIASGSPILRPVWRTCVTYPLPTSNNSDAMCRQLYREAAAWGDVDSTIARMALEDIAMYIEKTKAQFSLPNSIHVLGPDVVSWNDGHVAPDWRTNESVRMYCEERGYAPPTAHELPDLNGDVP